MVKTQYKSPLNIPEGKAGKFQIKHKVIEPGENIPIVSKRDALFSGKKAVTALVTTPITIHQLFETGAGLWMTDSPQEQELHKDVVKKCNGNVLIGGLGLGYIAQMLANKDSVKKFTVVEKEQAVIDLVWKHLKFKSPLPYRVLNFDLFDYLSGTTDKYDWAYYDIWAPTGEDLLYTHIRPLKTLSKGKVRLKNIICWAESTMVGQLMFNLYTSIKLLGDTRLDTVSTMTNKQFDDYYRYSRTQWPFFNWLRETKPSKELALVMAKQYCSTYTDYEKWSKVWEEWER